MPPGPGKYDALAMHCLKEAQAEGVILLVFNGNKGSGICGKKIDYEIAGVEEVIRSLPDILREVARNIEKAPPYSFIASDS
jgi:hypothetical protein